MCIRDRVNYDPVWRIIETGYWEVDYSWDDANGDAVAQEEELGRIRYTDIAEKYTIDPDLRSPYIDEATIGFEKRLTPDLGLSLNFIFRENKRFFWEDNRAIDPQTDYTPVTAQDPGPDGELGTSDDGGNITVYSLDDEKVGIIDYYITEQEGYKTSYRGMEFVLTKKYSHKWQLMASLTWGRSNVKLPLEAVDDPNNREFNDDVPEWNDSPLVIKILGSCELPWGFTFGGFFNYRTGLPSQRYFSYSGLNQGRINVDTQKYGSERYPDLIILDLRLSKVFRLGKYGVIEVMADLFNTFNSYTTLDWDEESWEGYHSIYTVLAPRILRLGLKWQF